MTGSAGGGAPAALGRLATALGPGFSTALVTGTGRQPCLAVVDQRTYAAEDACADDSGWFWWSWAEPIAATEDPLTAARRVTATLRGLA